MNKLGTNNYNLLSVGVKTTGNWLEAYNYCYEQLFCHEAEELYKFCKWLEDNNKAFGWGNYEDVFQEFLNDK